MKLRFGLQAKFLAMMAIALLVVLALIVLLLNRQERMQGEVVGVSREAMSGMIADNLKRHSEGMVAQLAESLANPLYYFDLDAVGVLSRATLRNPGISYVLVYDNDGNIVHDGSEEIPSYGKRMDDPMAFEVIAARKLHTQSSDTVMDVSAPIMIGAERLGGVRVGYDLKTVHQFQDQALGSLRGRLDALAQQHMIWIGLLAAGLLALGALMIYLIQRFLVQPIRQLADASMEIEAGHFDTSTPASNRHDEVGDLMRAFGRMSQSLARHDRDIRRMAYTDALTGLANRLAFRETLDEAQRKQWDAALAALLNAKRATLYKLAEGEPQPVMVRLGASDGTDTEISGGGLKAGVLVVVGERAKAKE